MGFGDAGGEGLAKLGVGSELFVAVLKIAVEGCARGSIGTGNIEDPNEIPVEESDPTAYALVVGFPDTDDDCDTVEPVDD